MANQVSEDIVAYCTNCKLDLANVIVALDGKKVKKVLCKNCDKEHVYKAPKKGKAPPKKKRTTAKSKKITISPLEEWEKAMAQSKDAPISVYEQDGSFKEGEKVDHRSFGKGLITKLIHPNKMEVIFEEGTKFMIRGSS
jgi:hypothetical protein